MTQVRVCDPSAGPGILSHLLEIIHEILFFVVQCWAWVPGYHACSVTPTEFYPSSGVPYGPDVPACSWASGRHQQMTNLL